MNHNYIDITSFFWDLLYDIVHLDYERLEDSESFLKFKSILDQKFMIQIENDVLFFDTVEEVFDDTYSYLLEFRPYMTDKIYYLERSLKNIELFTHISSLADEIEKIKM